MLAAVALVDDVNIARFLVDKDPNTIEQINEYHVTALMMAVYHGKENMVLFLLEKNANVLHQDIDGVTALMMAAKKIINILQNYWLLKIQKHWIKKTIVVKQSK